MPTDWASQSELEISTATALRIWSLVLMSPSRPATYVTVVKLLCSTVSALSPKYGLRSILLPSSMLVLIECLYQSVWEVSDLTGTAATGANGFVIESSTTGTQLGTNIEAVRLNPKTGQDLIISTLLPLLSIYTALLIRGQFPKQRALQDAPTITSIAVPPHN